MSTRTRRALLRAAVALAVAVPLGAPAAVSAAPRPARDLTVMTRNLYLGADLAPALQAGTPTQLLMAVAQIYGGSLLTDFPSRSAALAAEVAAAHPDLIGVEEASRWTVEGASTAPDLDYLAILQARLAVLGLHYQVAAASENADIGPLPLVGPLCASAVVGACTVEFQDRDAVLVRTDRPGLSVGNPRSGHYTAQELVVSPLGTLSFDRGWATVDGTLWGQRFRFAVTHLETETYAAVQEAQGLEFLQAVRAPGAVVAVGDFNSAADGSQTATYGEVTADYFRDAWPFVSTDPGLSCCQASMLDNTASLLHSRIDLVLTHAVHPMSATVVGATPFRLSAPPYWASDHAGVVATVRLH